MPIIRNTIEILYTNIKNYNRALEHVYRDYLAKRELLPLNSEERSPITNDIFLLDYLMETNAEHLKLLDLCKNGRLSFVFTILVSLDFDPEQFILTLRQKLRQKIPNDETKSMDNDSQILGSISLVTLQLTVYNLLYMTKSSSTWIPFLSIAVLAVTLWYLSDIGAVDLSIKSLTADDEHYKKIYNLPRSEEMGASTSAKQFTQSKASLQHRFFHGEKLRQEIREQYQALSPQTP